jgi:hypothetical protein
MIEAFFFNDEQLFGCFHSSNVSNSSRLLVICPPFFDEYRRCYRGLADLSIAIAEQGVHVFRFDYFGTGESQGLLEHASVGKWIKDVDAAIEEGISLCGADEVILLGIRFGATISAQSKHDRVSRYIFWDPIVNGSFYLRWLDEVNRQIKKEHQWESRYLNTFFEDIDYENFHLTPKLRGGIETLLLNQKMVDQIAQSFIITTDQAVADSKIFVNCEFPGFSYDWPAYHNGLISPKPVLQSIARRVVIF